MDMINRQAAINALIRKMRPHNNGDGTMTICAMSEGLVRETLNELPSAQPEQQWIPCTEKLPKLGEVVLWCNKKGSVFTSAITYMKDNTFSVGQHSDTIAWMPLPKPYKKGEYK